MKFQAKGVDNLVRKAHPFRNHHRVNIDIGYVANTHR